MIKPTLKTGIPQKSLNLREHLGRKLVIGVSMCALLAGLAVPQFVNSASASSNQAIQGQIGAPDFASLVEKVKPAVVSVQVKIDPTRRVAANGNQPDMQDPFHGENPFKGTPFEHFFENSPFQFHNMPRNNRPHGPLEHALGSGFFISADGYAITNNHVVDGATNVEVVTDDDQNYKAEVIGTDPKTDLALIKVKGRSDFPFVKMAKDKPKIGEWVLAVGNPFGLGGTVTAGIVSAEGRDIGSGPYDDYIQIDAAVNRGNSGGPTFNLAGDVVGINTAIFSPSGGNVGIAFDVPATTVNQVIPQLKEKGRVDRAWLGVQIQPVTEDIAQSLGLSDAKGALISQPQENSPAETANLKSGDVITKVDGVTVEDARDLARKIGNMEPDTKVALTVVRDGKERNIRVTLGEMKNDQPRRVLSQNEQSGQNLEKLGLGVAPASSVEGAGEEGIVVTDVDPTGPAADVGIQVGDVILKIGDKDISSAKELQQALGAALDKGRSKALALIKHGDNQRYVALPAKSASS